MTELPRRALFLDRDGTLIEDRGDLSAPSQVVFLPGVTEALLQLQRQFTLFIVTNQSAVAARRLTMSQVDAVNRRVVDVLNEAGVRIEEVFVCPHARADGCECIKPKPHFLRVAERKYNVDLSRSFTIGDHPHDVDFGCGVGATGIYVLTGHGERHRAELGPQHPVVAALPEALPWLIQNASVSRP